MEIMNLDINTWIEDLLAKYPDLNGRFMISLTFLVLILGIYRLLSSSIKALGKREEVDEHIQNILRLILRISTIFIIISTVFTIFELDATLFLSGSAIVGAAIGFGSSQTINNIVAGLYVIFSRPFKIKDYVRIGDVEGQVENISINYTSLYTPSFNLMRIPNTQVMNNRVLNCTHEGYIKYTFTLSFPHSEIHNNNIIKRCMEPAIEEFYMRYQELQIRRPEAYFESSVSFGRSFKIRIFIPRGEAKSLYVLQAELSDLIMTKWDQEKREK